MCTITPGYGSRLFNECTAIPNPDDIEDDDRGMRVRALHTGVRERYAAKGRKTEAARQVA